MAIDASLYGQIRQPQAPNLLGQLAQVQQLQAASDQNKLAQLAFQDRERALADAAAQREAVKGFGADSTVNYNRLLQTGNLSAAQAYQKGITENQKAQAEISQKGVEAGTKAFDQYKALLGTAQDPQQAASIISASYQDPVVGPILQRFGTLEEGLQRLQQATRTPQEFQQWKATAAIGMERLAELAKVQNVNTGGQTITQSVNPATGQVTQLGAQQNTISPDAQLQANTSTANNIRTTAATRDVAQATRDAAKITSNSKNEGELRKEFNDLPEVKNLKSAIPAYQSLVNAAKSNNPQADINLIYGLAKLYDPTSVVREGEYGTIANSQTIPEWLKGQAQRLAGGGRLTAETKDQLMQQAKIRLDAYQSEVDGARQGYDEIARRNGWRPENVFVPIGEQTRRGVSPQSAPTGFKILGVE